jgi:hypothetical protein
VFGWLNDAWLYDEINNLFIWYGGSNQLNQLSTYPDAIGATRAPGGTAEFGALISNMTGGFCMGRGYGGTTEQVLCVIVLGLGLGLIFTTR